MDSHDREIIAQNERDHAEAQREFYGNSTGLPFERRKKILDAALAFASARNSFGFRTAEIIYNRSYGTQEAADQAQKESEQAYAKLLQELGLTTEEHS